MSLTRGMKVTSIRLWMPESRHRLDHKPRFPNKHEINLKAENNWDRQSMSIWHQIDGRQPPSRNDYFHIPLLEGSIITLTKVTRVTLAFFSLTKVKVLQH